jgi:PIN domain nuclease of toxin-antitoxin system
VRVLLDTHALLWFISEHDRLSGAAREVVEAVVDPIEQFAVVLGKIIARLPAVP